MRSGKTRNYGPKLVDVDLDDDDDRAVRPKAREVRRFGSVEEMASFYPYLFREGPSANVQFCPLEGRTRQVTA